MRLNGYSKGICGPVNIHFMNEIFTDVYTRALGFISHICEKHNMCLYSGGVLTRAITVYFIEISYLDLTKYGKFAWTY